MKFTVFTGLFVSLLFSFTLSAQNSMLHWNSESNYNPASSGVMFRHSANINFWTPHRSNYFPNNNLNVNYNTRIGDQHGIGVNYSFNETHFQHFNSVALNYNYQFNFDKKRNHILSIGTGVNYTNRFIQDYWIVSTSTTDPLLPAYTQHTFSLNLGLRYQWRELGIGISNTSLFNTETNTNNIRLTENPGLNVMVNYNFKIGESFAIKPIILYRNYYDFHSILVSALFTVKNKYWVGLSYQNKNRLGFMFGWDINEKVRIGYAYDEPYSPQAVNPTTHSANHQFTIGLRLR